MNVSSTGALVGHPKLAAYSAAKAALIGFSRQLAFDLGTDRIRVNVVAPGDTRTPMTVPLQWQLGRGDLAAGEAQIAARNMLGRLGEAHGNPPVRSRSCCLRMRASAPVRCS